MRVGRTHLTPSCGLATACTIVLALLASAPARAQEVVDYYGTDHLGSVRVVFDASGTVVARADYLPYGEEVFAPIGPIPAERFTGQSRDGEAGQDYFHARMYQPRTGRFNAVDPIYAGLFDPQQWNRYAYARNNPLFFVDPSGLNLMACSVTNYQGGKWIEGYGWVDGLHQQMTCETLGGGGGGFNPITLGLDTSLDPTPRMGPGRGTGGSNSNGTTTIGASDGNGNGNGNGNGKWKRKWERFSELSQGVIALRRPKFVHCDSLG